MPQSWYENATLSRWMSAARASSQKQSPVVIFWPPPQTLVGCTLSASTHLRLASAWVPYEQHVALPPDVGACLVAPRTAANECDGNCQLHQEQTIDLQRGWAQDTNMPTLSTCHRCTVS